MAARKSRPPTVYRRLQVYIKSAVAGAAAAGALLLLSSLFMFFLKIPLEYSGFFSFASFGAGCLAAGFTAGMLKRRQGLLSGMAAALLFAVPVVLTGIILSGFWAGLTGQTAVTLNATLANVLSKVTAAVICGCAGGVFGVNKNKGFV